MKILTHTYRIRLSKDDIFLLKELKRHRIKPTTFMRDAFREKVEKEMPLIIEKESKLKAMDYCPF